MYRLVVAGFVLFLCSASSAAAQVPLPPLSYPMSPLPPVGEAPTTATVTSVSGTRPPAPTSNVRPLSRGMRGSDVADLQRRLIMLGLLSGDSATGLFGPATESAVRTFQRQNNIVQSGTPSTTGYGRVGAQTRAAIERAVAAVDDSSTSNAQTSESSPANATGSQSLQNEDSWKSWFSGLYDPGSRTGTGASFSTGSSVSTGGSSGSTWTNTANTTIGSAGNTTTDTNAKTVTDSRQSGSGGVPSVAFSDLIKHPQFHSYGYSAKIVDEVKGTGIHIYNVDTNLFGDDNGFSTDAAPEAGIWNYQPLISTLQLIVERDPDARFILRPFAGAPRWWREQAPQCQLLDESGKATAAYAVSSVCTALREHWIIGIGELKKALTDSGMIDRVAAFTLTGQSSQEWINWDNGFNVWAQYKPMAYGEADVRDYADWTRRTYGVEKNPPTQAQFLNATFIGDANRSTFLSTSDPAELNVIWYYQYRSQATAESITYLAEQLKKAFNNRPVGVIYGYMNEFSGNPTAGHNALSRILSASSIDYINPMPSYSDRGMGGADLERQPITSVTLRGKRLFNDLDIGTSVSKQNYDALCASYGYPAQCVGNGYIYAMQGLFGANGVNGFVEPNAYSDVSNFRRFLGFSLARNMYFSYLSLHPSPSFTKSYISADHLLTAVSQINATRAAASYSSASVAQVLVVSDEHSNDFMRFGIGDVNEHSLKDALVALNKSGVPYDHVLLSDLSLVNAAQYRLVVFLNTWSVDASTRKLITEKFKNSGRVLMFTYASGLYDGARKSESNIKNFTGVKVVSLGSKKQPVMNMPSSADSWFRKNYTVQTRFQTPPDRYVAADGVQIAWDTDDYATAAYAPQQGWSSVWLASADVPPGVFRDIARAAGAHVYSESDDALYANRSFIALVAATAGTKRIAFKSPVTLYEAVSGTLLKRNVTQYDFTAARGEVILLRTE